MPGKIKLGISSCLLGEKVRYDGGHKRDHFLTDTLGQYLEYVSVCPEKECGLGIPREAARLESDSGKSCFVTEHTGKDCTNQIMQWAQNRIKTLEQEGLCGFIFKKNSPSCGIKGVSIYNAEGIPKKKGIGVFARMYMERFTLIPVSDESRLHDPKSRDNFIDQIFTLKQWREVLAKNKRSENLLDFHARHKLLILSHSKAHYRMMERLVLFGEEIPINEAYKKYEELLIAALKLKTTVKKNIQVLKHIKRYFEQQVSPDEKKELLEILCRYQEGNIPLVVPITLANHYAWKYKQPYLAKQTYLRPHPVMLQLKNHT